MNYNLLKEAQPEETIKCIKNILDNINIKLNEKIIKYEKENKYNPYSLKICIQGHNQYCTNGKGSSLINAKASAYAEFMERLQSQFLLLFNNDKFIYSPDEKIIDIKNLENNIINEFIRNKNLLNQINLLANSIFDKEYLENNKVILVPFYDYKNNSIIDLPVYILSFVLGSTGLSAGNTIEEALVQGLSEICERFVQTKVINENLSMPDIPYEKYMKYEKISGMIKVFEENGYCVSVKDASLGRNLPVVSTVIYDKKSDTISIKFGAHPSFAIAVERCLTEFAQGQDITADHRHISFESFVSECGLYWTVKENNLNFLNEKIQKCNIFIENCDYIQEQFFKRKPDFALSEKAWIKTDKNIDNKSLLKFLLTNIKQYTDEIYIRDISFLGFPSVMIVIPKMTFIIDNKDQRIKYKSELQNWIKDGMPENKNSVEFLFKAIASQGPPIFYREYNTSSKFPNEYLLLLCSILLKDYKNIKKYSDCIILNKKSYEVYKKEFMSNIILTNEFFNMKSENITEEKIFEILYKNFSEEDINRFKTFIKYLSFNVIKNIIINYNTNLKDKNENDEELNNIKNKIINKMYQNLPSQTALSSIFADI